MTEMAARLLRAEKNWLDLMSDVQTITHKCRDELTRLRLMDALKKHRS